MFASHGKTPRARAPRGGGGGLSTELRDRGLRGPAQWRRAVSVDSALTMTQADVLATTSITRVRANAVTARSTC